MHVHIEEACSPRAQHLQTSQPSPHIDIVGSHLGLHGPDIVLEPLHQGQVIAVAPEEGHRSMRMGVDEAWDDSLVRPIDHLCTLWGGEVRGNASYAVALDEDVSDGVLVEDILDQYGHAGGGYLLG